MSKELIDPIREEIDAAWLRSDPDGITRHLDEDAILLPPNSPRLVGRDQINRWLREFFQHYTMVELVMPERELIIVGSMAVERSVYQWTLQPRELGDSIRDEANFVGVWRKSPEGTWTEVCGIWNSALPVVGVHSAAAAEAAGAR
jgi:ketosteroid isomerase-like protein